MNQNLNNNGLEEKTLVPDNNIKEKKQIKKIQGLILIFILTFTATFGSCVLLFGIDNKNYDNKIQSTTITTPTTKAPTQDTTPIRKPEYYEQTGLMEDYEYLYDKAKTIGSKYGVVIAIADQVPDSELPEETVAGYGPSVKLFDKKLINEALDKVDEILGAYPDNFFEQLKYGGYDELRIFIIGFCSIGLGFATTTDDFHYIALDVENSGFIESLDYTMNHEISHIIDRVLLSMPNNDSGTILDDDVWSSYNPKDFVYSNGDGDLESEMYNKYPEYFSFSYGAQSQTEDRATLFGNIMSHYMEGSGEKYPLPEPAAKKYKYYTECIRKGFATTNWPEKMPWEI